MSETVIPTPMPSSGFFENACWNFEVWQRFQCIQKPPGNPGKWYLSAGIAFNLQNTFANQAGDLFNSDQAPNSNYNTVLGANPCDLVTNLQFSPKLNQCSLFQPTYLTSGGNFLATSFSFYFYQYSGCAVKSILLFASQSTYSTTQYMCSGDADSSGYVYFKSDDSATGSSCASSPCLVQCMMFGLLSDVTALNVQFGLLQNSDGTFTVMYTDKNNKMPRVVCLIPASAAPDPYYTPDDPTGGLDPAKARATFFGIYADAEAQYPWPLTSCMYNTSTMQMSLPLESSLPPMASWNLMGTTNGLQDDTFWNFDYQATTLKCFNNTSQLFDSGINFVMENQYVKSAVYANDSNNTSVCFSTFNGDQWDNSQRDGSFVNYIKCNAVTCITSMTYCTYADTIFCSRFQPIYLANVSSPNATLFTFVRYQYLNSTVPTILLYASQQAGSNPGGRCQFDSSGFAYFDTGYLNCGEGTYNTDGTSISCPSNAWQYACTVQCMRYGSLSDVVNRNVQFGLYASPGSTWMTLFYTDINNPTPRVLCLVPASTPVNSTYSPNPSENWETNIPTCPAVFFGIYTQAEDPDCLYPTSYTDVINAYDVSGRTVPSVAVWNFYSNTGSIYSPTQGVHTISNQTPNVQLFCSFAPLEGFSPWSATSTYQPRSQAIGQFSCLTYDLYTAEISIDAGMTGSVNYKLTTDSGTTGGAIYIQDTASSITTYGSSFNICQSRYLPGNSPLTKFHTNAQAAMGTYFTFPNQINSATITALLNASLPLVYLCMDIGTNEAYTYAMASSLEAVTAHTVQDVRVRFSNNTKSTISIVTADSADPKWTSDLLQTAQYSVPFSAKSVSFSVKSSSPANGTNYYVVGLSTFTWAIVLPTDGDLVALQCTVASSYLSVDRITQGYSSADNLYYFDVSLAYSSPLLALTVDSSIYNDLPIILGSPNTPGQKPIASLTVSGVTIFTEEGVLVQTNATNSSFTPQLDISETYQVQYGTGGLNTLLLAYYLVFYEGPVDATVRIEFQAKSLANADGSQQLVFTSNTGSITDPVFSKRFSNRLFGTVSEGGSVKLSLYMATVENSTGMDLVMSIPSILPIPYSTTLSGDGGVVAVARPDLPQITFAISGAAIAPIAPAPSTCIDDGIEAAPQVADGPGCIQP